VPVGSRQACELLAQEADAIVCCRTPISFRAVGAWYGDFSEVGDDEVAALLGAPSSAAAMASSPRGGAPRHCA
jgi:predicted phosphoribosyltransferase